MSTDAGCARSLGGILGYQTKITPGTRVDACAKPRSSAQQTLFFTAGPNDEADGLFGTIRPAS